MHLPVVKPSQMGAFSLLVVLRCLGACSEVLAVLGACASGGGAVAVEGTYDAEEEAAPLVATGASPVT